MHYRFWRAVDAVAHFLYCPAMLGRRIAVAKPVHEVHWRVGLTREEL